MLDGFHTLLLCQKTYTLRLFSRLVFVLFFFLIMDFSDAFELISFHGKLSVPYGSQETALVSSETIEEEGEPFEGASRR